ncbi:MAG: glutamate--tRNA ligase family protein, partial [Verrucomicrobiota bacterium]|nr:glutamate--tRNA ligase family protein [Verrucomicrobiota bacterium]
VVDDHAMGITEIVRGMDLLVSSARQCLLFDALELERPAFCHCGLLLDEEGRKLSKSERNLPRLFPKP